MKKFNRANADKPAAPKKILRILGVGFDKDGHTRITHGDKSSVYMGTEETHEFISQLCNRIEERLKEQGLTLQDITIEQLQEIIQDVL